jgi:hypothetical protein
MSHITRLQCACLQGALKHKAGAKKELQESFGLLVGHDYQVLAFMGE